jgi:hypothetical protein
MIRELGVDGRPEPEPAGRITGRMRWRGSVDEEVHVVVQGSSASVRLLSGQALPPPAVTFILPLPQPAVTVQLVNIRGRGSIEVLQHPSRNNDYTAVIQICEAFILARREATQDPYIVLTMPLFVASLFRTSASTAMVARRGTMLAATRIGVKE